MSAEAAGVTVRPVVVGIDGSAAAWCAVDWAAAEAARHRAPLRIVHAAGGVAARAIAASGSVANRWPALVRDWVDTARDVAGATAPGVAVRVAVVAATVNEVLLAQSEDASVLVVGSRGLERPIEALPTSTVTFAAMHAHCPVVVVPMDAQHPTGVRPVVLGVDGSVVSEAAIGFAFDAASARAAALVAVHAVNDAVADPLPGTAEGWEFLRRHQDGVLADRLARWQDKYPDVVLERVVLHDRPVTALLRYGANAQLLVVGSRGRGDFAGMLLGSTSQALLYCTPCPIAVVRTLEPTGQQTSAGHGSQLGFPDA